MSGSSRDGARDPAGFPLTLPRVARGIKPPLHTREVEGHMAASQISDDEEPGPGTWGGARYIAQTWMRMATVIGTPQARAAKYESDLAQ